MISLMINIFKHFRGERQCSPVEQFKSLQDEQQHTFSERTGTITALRSNNGTIDHYVFFELETAGGIASELRKGCQVKYLAYDTERNESTRVVKILEVLDGSNWDEPLPNAKNLKKEITELQLKQPKFVDTCQRTIPGLVVAQQPKYITVDTEQQQMKIYLDSVEIDFVPHVGDCVHIFCNEENEQNSRSETLQVVRVHPQRLLKQEKRTVTELFDEWGVLGRDCYFTYDILSTDCPPSVGDVVSCDLVECKWESYTWRCIKLAPFIAIKLHNIKKGNNKVAANRRHAANIGERASEIRYKDMELRHYANEVWDKKNEVVPGVESFHRRRFIFNRIGQYEVPESLRRVFLTTRFRGEMEESLERMFPVLKTQLNFNNYVQRIKTIIYLEEIELNVQIRKYDCERAHFMRDGAYLSLTIENLNERRPSLVIGDKVRVVNRLTKTENHCFDGVIHKVLCNRILLKFNDGFQSSYSGEEFRLEFHFSRFLFRKRHYATRQAEKQLGEHFLFPSKMIQRDRQQLDAELDSADNLYVGGKLCQWFNGNLNSVQKRAVTYVLRGEADSMPYVIFGPPGTGKTLTIIEVILQLLKHIPSARLLMATPSNSAADLIALRIIDCKQLRPGGFLRLLSQTHLKSDSIPEKLMPYCATIDMGKDGSCDETMIVTESGLKLGCQMKFIARHRLTIGTCTTIGNFLQMGFPPGHFTHVIIDEAGQCLEPDVMMPICLVSPAGGQVILAGDPKQLSGMVINRYAADLGYSTSFLERLLRRPPYVKDMVQFSNTSGFDPRLVTKLLYNHRSLPSILKVFSTLFYESELLPMINETNSPEALLLRKLDKLLPESKVRPKSHGVFFFGTNGKNEQAPDAPSWYNPLEARYLFHFVIKLYLMDIEPESIGIISPYAKQVKHLRELFKEFDVPEPKIGSVEEFQGQERDIILVSTVRSCPNYLTADLLHSMGFIHSTKRLNVAISRARSLLYVFGNPRLLCLDEHWRAFIKYCVDNEAYLGCALPDTFHLHTNDTLI